MVLACFFLAMLSVASERYRRGDARVGAKDWVGAEDWVPVATYSMPARPGRPPASLQALLPLAEVPDVRGVASAPRHCLSRHLAP